MLVLLTWTNDVECAVKVVLVNIGKDRNFLCPNLLVRSHDNKKETVRKGSSSVE